MVSPKLGRRGWRRDRSEIAADAAMRTAIIGVADAFIVALVGIGSRLLTVKLNADRERERMAHEERVRQSEAARAAARQILRHVEEGGSPLPQPRGGQDDRRAACRGAGTAHLRDPGADRGGVRQEGAGHRPLGVGHALHPWPFIDD